jgi:CRP/FNR family nitrogen fixation transcriptional regulator
VSFDQDRAIYSEDDEAVSFFKVISGVVRTCRFLRDGRKLIDAFYAEGEMFGIEVGNLHKLTAEAASDCKLMSFRRGGLDTELHHDATLSSELFSYAMSCLNRAQEHALLLGRKCAVERLAVFLLSYSRRANPSVTIELEMTRQDIADFLGLTIETVSRSFTLLQKIKAIELTGPRCVRITDRQALLSLSR